MNWKECGGSDRGIFEGPLRNLPGETEGNHEEYEGRELKW